MPMMLIDVYRKEMPKINAEEHLALIRSLAVGGGNLGKKESTRIMKALTEDAAGPKAKKIATASIADMKKMGIAVEVVKKAEVGNG